MVGSTNAVGADALPGVSDNSTLGDGKQFDNEILMAQARPKEGVDWLTDFNDAVYDAGSKLIDKLPPSMQPLAKLLRNTPPDVNLLGSVVDVPGLGKMSWFMLQPSTPSNPLIPQNPLGPDGKPFTDDDVPPIIFFAIPARNVVGTYNPSNGQVEFGPGAAQKIAPDTIFYYNTRSGGRDGGTAAVGGVGSQSINFGILNSTVSDPILDYGVYQASRGVTAVARALQAAGIIGTLASPAPGDELPGAAGALTVELFRHVIINEFNQRNEWYIGLGYRGADLEIYNNGEKILNFSGAKIRLSDGEGPGGSGLSPDKFIYDASNSPNSLVFDPRRILESDDPIAKELGNIIFQAHYEHGRDPQDAYDWIRAGYADGGIAKLQKGAMETLSANTPDSVNDRAFVRMGMGEQSAILAKGIYDHLKENGDEAGLSYSPRQAWGAVWSSYISGNRLRIDSGLVNGGDAGGMNGLRDLAAKIGLDPTPYLPRELR